MEMEFLGDSSCVSSAGYEAGYLTIEFTDNSIYTYHDVSPQVYGAFKRSPSKGWYFNKNIRNNYSWTEGPAPDLDVQETGRSLLENMLGPEFFYE